MIDAALVLLRKVPGRAWIVAGLVAALVAAVVGVRHWHQEQITAAFAAGRYSVQSDAARVHLAQRETVTVVTARTDTVTRRVVQRIAVVESLIVAVPESVRVAVPVVDTALKACTALAQDCAAMRVAFADERAARVALQRSTDAGLTAKADTIAQLQQRPRWRTLVLTAATVGVVGWLGGRR